MSTLAGLAWLLVALAVGGGVFLAVRNPAWLYGLAKAILADLLPTIVRAMRPRDLSPEERQRYREGLPWWRDRPPGEGGGGGRQ